VGKAGEEAGLRARFSVFGEITSVHHQPTPAEVLNFVG
jgi:hypothetical protein